MFVPCLDQTFLKFAQPRGVRAAVALTSGSEPGTVNMLQVSITFLTLSSSLHYFFHFFNYICSFFP